MPLPERVTFRLSPADQALLEELMAKMQAATPYSRVSITDVMRFAVSSAHAAIDQPAHTATSQLVPFPAGMKPDEPDTA
jgi:hypothetical protein